MTPEQRKAEMKRLDKISDHWFAQQDEHLKLAEQARELGWKYHKMSMTVGHAATPETEEVSA